MLKTKIRYALYKHGYVHEDGTITDSKLIQFQFTPFNEIPEDCFVEEQYWDGLYWTSTEGL